MSRKRSRGIFGLPTHPCIWYAPKCSSSDHWEAWLGVARWYNLSLLWLRLFRCDGSNRCVCFSSCSFPEACNNLFFYSLVFLICLPVISNATLLKAFHLATHRRYLALALLLLPYNMLQHSAKGSSQVFCFAADNLAGYMKSNIKGSGWKGMLRDGLL